jgi:hypothetical protein
MLSRLHKLLHKYKMAGRKTLKILAISMPVIGVMLTGCNQTTTTPEIDVQDAPAVQPATQEAAYPAPTQIQPVTGSYPAPENAQQKYPAPDESSTGSTPPEATAPEPRQGLAATDPEGVLLAAGKPTLVEFFAFW